MATLEGFAARAMVAEARRLAWNNLKKQHPDIYNLPLEEQARLRDAIDWGINAITVQYKEFLA